MPRAEDPNPNIEVDATAKQLNKLLLEWTSLGEEHVNVQAALSFANTQLKEGMARITDLAELSRKCLEDREFMEAIVTHFDQLTQD